MNAVGIRAIRQNEATRECGVNAFDVDCVFALVFAFRFAFAADGDDTVRDEISCRIGDIDAGRRRDLDLTITVTCLRPHVHCGQFVGASLLPMMARP
ncbi:MAG TPA: hypothetical protein VGO37_20450, partial [Steroidobacteraceae bacterium]|nr:hypothetical protein [Steroidobacteraceae bacterium]